MTRTIAWGIAALVLPLSVAIAGDTDSGKALFAAHCQRCHAAGPAAFKSVPDDLAAFLRASPLHSRIGLEEEQILQLTRYLGESRRGR